MNAEAGDQCLTTCFVPRGELCSLGVNLAPRGELFYQGGCSPLCSPQE
jgi:hypothetical protein